MKIKHCAAALASLVVAAQANAVVVSYSFTAVISYLFEHDSATGVNTPAAFSDFTGSRISVGDVVHGQFTFNTNAPLSAYQPEVPATGVYRLYSLNQADASFSYAVGANSFTSAGGYLSAQVANDASNFNGWDVFYLGATRAYEPAMSQDAGFALFDKTSTVFASAALPGELNLDNFFYKQMTAGWLRRADGDQLQLQAKITSLQAVTTVPEPATHAIMLAGLLAVGLASRRTASARR